MTEEFCRLVEIIAVADRHRNADHRPIQRNGPTAHEQDAQFFVDGGPVLPLEVIRQDALVTSQHGVEIASVVTL